MFAVVFAIGYRWYTKIPPGDNILGRFGGCIWVCMFKHVQANSVTVTANSKQMAKLKKNRKINANEIMVTINNEKVKIIENANDLNF